MDSTCAGDCLKCGGLQRRVEVSVNFRMGFHCDSTYSSFLDSGAFWAENEFLSSRGELSETLDGKVFVVEVRITP